MWPKIRVVKNDHKKVWIPHCALSDFFRTFTFLVQWIQVLHFLLLLLALLLSLSEMRSFHFATQKCNAQWFKIHILSSFHHSGSNSLFCSNIYHKLPHTRIILLSLHCDKTKGKLAFWPLCNGWTQKSLLYFQVPWENIDFVQKKNSAVLSQDIFVWGGNGFWHKFQASYML